MARWINNCSGNLQIIAMEDGLLHCAAMCHNLLQEQQVLSNFLWDYWVLFIFIVTFKVLLWSFLCYFVDNIFSPVFMKGRQIWFCWEDDAGVSTYLSWENSGSWICNCHVSSGQTEGCLHLTHQSSQQPKVSGNDRGVFWCWPDDWRCYHLSKCFLLGMLFFSVYWPKMYDWYTNLPVIGH